MPQSGPAGRARLVDRARRPAAEPLVETALAHNADLRAAAANLKAARAMVGEAAAAKLPIGTVDGGLHRSRTAGASLQLDTFGGLRSCPIRRWSMPVPRCRGRSTCSAGSGEPA
jgi:outer membrane protein TolC